LSNTQIPRSCPRNIISTAFRLSAAVDNTGQPGTTTHICTCAISLIFCLGLSRLVRTIPDNLRQPQKRGFSLGIKDWQGAVVGLKKYCAEYRSGTKQESGSQNLTFRLDLIKIDEFIIDVIDHRTSLNKYLCCTYGTLDHMHSTADMFSSLFSVTLRASRNLI